MSREEQNKKDWIDNMVKELDTEEKLRADLECYYNLMQVNSKVIEMLSNNLLSKPNYVFDVFEEMFEKRLDEVRDKSCAKVEFKKGCGNGLDGFHYCGEDIGGYVYLCDNCTKDEDEEMKKSTRYCK